MVQIGLNGANGTLPDFSRSSHLLNMLFQPLLFFGEGRCDLLLGFGRE
jgi:hypothetical protein